MKKSMINGLRCFPKVIMLKLITNAKAFVAVASLFNDFVTEILVLLEVPILLI